MLKNSLTQYGSVAKSFHWLMSAIIISLIAVGFIMINMDKSSLKFSLYDAHKLTGLSILMLVLFRLVWRLNNTVPNLDFVAHWEKLSARLGQWLLYTMMFIMPISGWIMSTAAGYIPSFFGLEIAFPIDKNEHIANLAKQVHEISAWVLTTLLLLHIIAALKSHLIDKNHILKRMLP